MSVENRRITVLGIPVDPVDMDQAVNILEERIRQQSPGIICTANAEMVMLAQNDAELRHILCSADLVLADGFGVVWAARRLAAGVPERVAGFDLTQNLLKSAARSGYRIFWLGAAPGIAAAAAQKAADTFPGLITVGILDGYFGNNDAEVITAIQNAKPDILLCALGVPRQEKWLWASRDKLQVPVMIGVGGTFDVMAGKMQRAPLWMQNAGLEWLYRLMIQPQRIFRMLALPRFVLKVIKTQWTSR